MKVLTNQYRNRLSPAELRVCSLVERSDKQIAYLLGLSVHTVKTHIASALRKTRADNRTALRLLMIEQEHTGILRSQEVA